MLAVCSLFGVYIKLSVQINISTASMGTETVAHPAVEVGISTAIMIL